MTTKPFLASVLVGGLCLIAADRVAAQAFTNLHSFSAVEAGSTNSDGAQPYDRLVLSGNTLYGTTSAGGDYAGTVFAVNTDGTGFRNVYEFTLGVSFNFPNGGSPEGGLILSGSTLYGTTEGGGASGWGTVFAVNTDGNGFMRLHSFSSSDGGVPRGSLVFSGNALYGTTEQGGGPQKQGTLFVVNTDSSGFTNLHIFSELTGDAETNSDGAEPNPDLILSGSTLYGTTAYGGTNDYGTIFSVQTNGTGFTVLHTFAFDDPNNGARPEAGLLLAGSTLYGTTLTGGTNATGLIFAVSTNGTGFTILHSLGIDEVGTSPYGTLILSSNTLYGTTIEGGTAFHGTVFAVTTNGTSFRALYNFKATAGTEGSYGTNSDGAYPWGGVILSSNVLYGTTHDGGASGAGTVFGLDLAAAPPPIQFTASPTNGAPALTVQFNAPGVDANGNPISSWLWDFGDSSTSTNQNPSHIYSTTGDFSPTLVATNVYGDVIDISGPLITVAPLPTVQYTASPTNGSAPLMVQFNSPGIDSDGNPITSWNWDFGDSSTSTEQNPSHTYTSAGDFSPTLVVTNNLGQAISGSGPSIAVGSPAQSGGHTLVAYYSFEDNNVFAHDFSGNGNDIDSYSYFSMPPYITNDVAAGSYALGEAGGSWLGAPTNLLATLAGSFSVSLWINTSDIHGNDDDDVYSATGIVSAFDGGDNDVMPMGLTGSKLAFYTGGSSQDTLHSQADVSATGQYVHVVVTRDQQSGEKKIYVNGALDASDVGSTDSLNDLTELDIGYNNGQVFTGDMDDIQIYAGVLSAAEVSQLYNNPGTTVTNVTGGGGGGGLDLGTVLNAPNLTWTTGGNANWFGETNTTYDGVSAAQSGPITDGQTSYVETTVPTDGQISFFWKISSEQYADLLTFYINGVQQDAISGEVDWNQQTYSVSSNDTLRWEYSKDESVSEGADAGWLDQVQYMPPPYPATVNFYLSIERYQDLTYGYSEYEVSPQISYVDPAPVTTNRVESPDGIMYSEVWSGDSYQDTGSGEGFNSLDELISACTNAPWTLYINKGDPSEQVFHFNVSISGLTTNFLGPVSVITPVANTANVATNTPFEWSGPTGFSSVFVETYIQFPSFVLTGYASLPGTATTWPSPPTLPYGTNYFYVGYDTYNPVNVTFTAPVEDNLTSLSSWYAVADLQSDLGMSFYVGAPEPLPFQISSAQRTGTNAFQFSFGSLPGRPMTVQVSTNLATGVWTDLTNFTGNGAIQQFVMPATNLPAEFFRVRMQ